MRKLKKKVVNSIYNILILICVIGFITTLFIILRDHQSFQLADQNYQEIRDLRIISNQNDSIGNTSIDFESLSKINPDIIGWIGFEGLEIDYPVVQTKDNEFYLNHLFSLEKNKLGAIFVDYRNKSDLSDHNTIIYGHNMKNGSMFSSLTNYKSQDYYDANPDILLVTKEKKYRIDFFAGLVVDGSYESVRFSFSDEDDFNQYINSLEDMSTFKSSVIVGPQDRIISLVTCSYEYNNARYALYGKLVELP